LAFTFFAYRKSCYLSLPMLQASTLQLLRFHFSLFLLPVFLFAISEVPRIDWTNALLLFFILHGLVYPASNGYNSYMDRDETPIGGLAHPMLPTRQLFYITILLDALALFLALYYLGPFTALGILCYILASRAYSWRGIRLKQYPVIGFLTVFIFQGALTFFISMHGASEGLLTEIPFLPLLTASFLIGALYPLTQIYQHQADLQDGVKTLSYLLGTQGTFIFSGILFAAAAALLFFWYQSQLRLNEFWLFLLMTLPVVLFFCWWMRRVWQDEKHANFRNSLRMNLVATGCTILFFSTLIYIHHFE
jgi:1,4-dihydroxy-2-naphthoate polyprenyltransferase